MGTRNDPGPQDVTIILKDGTKHFYEADTFKVSLKEGGWILILIKDYSVDEPYEAFPPGSWEHVRWGW